MAVGSLRAGVIGVGYLGAFHASKYKALENVDLVAVVDVDADRAQSLAQELGTQAYTDYRDILPQLDLVSIVVPTKDHYRIAKDCIDAGIHILIEKPITNTVADARSLVALAHERGVVLQVGHLERFNPAYAAALKHVNQPLFIESHRLAPFKSRGLDVDVILDLMIHDIDLVLALVGEEVVDIEAVGLPVITNGIDIANTRLKFANGCIANVTASRVSQKSMRMLRVFQHDLYLSIDCEKRQLRTLQKPGNGVAADSEMVLSSELEDFDASDVLMEEITAFAHSVNGGNAPLVSGEDATRALEIALEVRNQIEQKHGSGSNINHSSFATEASINEHPNG